jgi:UPF0716 family protein affecting phage T7 exclusion
MEERREWHPCVDGVLLVVAVMDPVRVAAVTARLGCWRTVILVVALRRVGVALTGWGSWLVHGDWIR